MTGEKLLLAKKKKTDEFYTQLSDIESEMRHYKEYFKNSIVFCNCDDPYESNFFKYFAMNFNFLELRKLIATCYVGSPIAGEQLTLSEVTYLDNSLLNVRQPYKIEITEVRDENADGAIDLSDVAYLLRNDRNTLTLLNGDGDFRSEECVDLLKQSDIVVTNPPFSLFREYLEQLTNYNKKFIIIGNKNAIPNKDTFALIKENSIFTGYRPMAGGMWFIVPENYDYDKEIDGIRLKNVPACWFTNFVIPKHHNFITLYRNYSPKEYITYDNLDAINVNRVSDIPYDWFGPMGVPITFLDKYNPNQFEIIGLDRYVEGNRTPNKRMMINGRELYARIIIKRKGEQQ